MVYAKILAWLAFIAMSLALGNGFLNGSFFEDGSELLANPWGIVSLVDLYAGFTLFAIWIAYRESRVQNAVLWIVALMILGFFIGAVYVLYALYTSEDDFQKALLGDKTPVS